MDWIATGVGGWQETNGPIKYDKTAVYVVTLMHVLLFIFCAYAKKHQRHDLISSFVRKTVDLQNPKVFTRKLIFVIFLPLVNEEIRGQSAKTTRFETLF